MSKEENQNSMVQNKNSCFCNFRPILFCISRNIYYLWTRRMVTM